MRYFCSVAVVIWLAATSAAQANDALHCLDLIAAERLDPARSVCRNLELGDPSAALAFAYFQLYVEVGGERLKKIALLGIDEAALKERRALEVARRYFLVAAEAGLPDAQMLLAMTIDMLEPAEFNVDGVRYNEEQSRWLTKAAEQGVAEANYQLGTRALSPSGTLLIHPEYLPYLERAARLGHDEATKRLAEYETATTLAATDSLDDPVTLRKHAAELWSSSNGDKREANRLMRLLANAGDEEAMLTVSRWAWPDDSAGAKKYLDMAAELGNDKAMIALGNWYACDGNPDESSHWFKKALAMKHPEARLALNELVEWGIDEWECRFL